MEKYKYKKFVTQINCITKKYITLLKQWEKEHPNWMNSESETQIYMHLLIKVFLQDIFIIVK